VEGRASACRLGDCAIDLEPQLIGAYVGLAGLYGTTGRLDPGLARAEEALKVNPKSQSALMHVGLLRERKVDIRKAMEAYERVLAVNPRFAPAANNLAYLLIENSGDKERAPAGPDGKGGGPRGLQTSRIPSVGSSTSASAFRGVLPAEVAQRLRVRVYRHGLPDVTGGFERIFAVCRDSSALTPRKFLACEARKAARKRSSH
jgi:tetratricopeptide (TPR) repeat protein